jgi:hypothetical protein
MVDGLHIPTWNRTKKPVAIALSEVGKGLRGRDNGSNVMNIQYKSNQNCHYKPPMYNEYILKICIKKKTTQRKIWIFFFLILKNPFYLA